MKTPPSASMLWAMHPAFLDSFLRQSTVDSMLPDTIRTIADGFAAGGNRASAPAPAPVQDRHLLIVPITAMLVRPFLRELATP